jgi:hypothetical protein
MTQQTAPSGITLPKKKSRYASLLVMATLGAIVLMALALGVLFWLGAQGSAPPSPEALIGQAAEAYGQSGNLAQAQHLLASIDADRRAQTFAKMEAAAPDETSRQRLIRLQQALHVPVVPPSLWDTLLSQNLILVSLALAALPLLGALVFGLLPVAQRLIRQLTNRQAAGLEAELELLALDSADEPMEVKGHPDGEWPEATEPAQLKPQDAKLATPAPETPPQTDANQPVVEPHMQDILSSVFESEGATLKYEALNNALVDVETPDLLVTGRRVAQQLRALSASASRNQEGK